MKEFKCIKCNSEDVFIKASGAQTGLYCGDCGKWIQWLNRQDQLLAERFIERKLATTSDGVSAKVIASALSEITKVAELAGVSIDEAVNLIVAQKKQNKRHD